MRTQVASDFYPVSISCGCRVSCAETLLVDGVLARWAVRARSEPAARLIFSPSLSYLPLFRTMSELFYSDMAQFSGSQIWSKQSIFMRLISLKNL